MSLSYVIVGAGGVGGSVAAFLGMAGRDVTLIARGSHLDAMKENGLIFVRDGGEQAIPAVKALSSEEYLTRRETPDVIFLCTKSYSVKEVAPFIRQAAGKSTLVISLLNGIAAAEQIRELLPGVKVADGLIYIFARKDGDGRIYLSGDRMHIYFGTEDPEVSREKLETIQKECTVPGMKATLSEDIQKEVLRKFSLVGSMAVTALVYHCPMGPLMKPGEERDFYREAIGEVVTLGEKLGIHYEEDLIERNLTILDRSRPEDTTSLQRDVEAGGPCETDAFILRPIRLGERCGVDMKCWKRAADAHVS